MKRFLSILLALTLFSVTASAQTVKLSPDNPQVLTLWHYYNGMQQQTFDQLVLEFNETVGMEKGIIIEPMSQGGVNDLTDKLMDAANRKTGADNMPDIFAAYADTAHAVNKMGLVADISAYMTEEEQAEYMDSYMAEGRLDAQGGLKVFPIAKSTEMTLINKTEWDAFVADTGADINKLATWEGVVEISKAYYEWSGGKAFFGRDAFANYILIGSLQLGVEMFQVENDVMTLNIDDQVMRRLWDNYVVPYVNGWFGAYGRFRSDDVKTGQLVALVGSTSGALYFPKEVTRDDGSTYAIESLALPLPNFEGTSPCAVQQGAGMVVTKSTPEKEYAATVFLKWFTEVENNIAFSLSSGYLPVKKAANDPEVLHEIAIERGVTGLLHDIIHTGAQITSTYRLYTNNAFDNGYEARQVVDTSMVEAAEHAKVELALLVEAGMAREEAIERLTGDEAFEAWLAKFKADMEQVLNN
ncbi:MAG: extracellular solute-binding protein [Clostridia bacterium]|nr:extracellular solute-binding protein [Clostridia bacterium]